MFQVTNPLRFYTQNPLSEDNGEPEEVPNLTQSQIRLKKTNKVTTYIIYACTGILLAILFATVGLTIFNKIRERGIEIDEGEKVHIETYVEKTVETISTPEEKVIIETTINVTVKGEPIEGCPDCLVLDFKNLNEPAIRALEDEINRQLAKATSLDTGRVDGTLINVGNYTEKLRSIPELKDKIDELVNLNKTFGNALLEVAGYQKDMQALRESYDNKVGNITQLKEKVLDHIRSSAELETTINGLNGDLEDVKNEIDRRTRDIETEKDEIKSRIQELKNKIAEKLRSADAYDEKDLDNKIAQKLKNIDEKETQKKDCEINNAAWREEISTLTIQLRKYEEDFARIDLRLRQWKWVSHIINTIKKFEDIRDQLINLKTTQLLDAQKNIAKHIQNLKTRTQLLNSELSQMAIEGESKKTEETEVSAEGGQVTITKTIIESNKREVDIANLKLAVEREQFLLKVWALEQFKTVNVSTHEINNITSTINSLKDSIKGYSEEYIEFQRLQDEINTITVVIKTNITTHETAITECDRVIDTNQAIINSEERERGNLVIVRDNIAQWRNDIANEQANLDGSSTSKISELENKKADISNRIKEAEKKLRNQKSELEGLTGKINAKIVESPHPETVKKASEQYQDKIESVKDLFRKLTDLVEYIKNLEIRI